MSTATNAAIFDLDGTLVRGTSAERLLVPWLVRRRVVGRAQLAPALSRLATLPFAGLNAAVRANKRWLTGAPVDVVVASMPLFLDEQLMPRLNGTVLERMDRLRGGGARTWLLTGAPDFVARAVAGRLRMDGWVGTALEVREGCFTGEIAGRHVYAAAKTQALAEIAAAHALDLAASHGFADRASDIAFLECFGRAVAVAPDRALRRAAHRRGWDVLG